ALPYALWALVAQNVERPRHGAPLALFACVALGLAIARATSAAPGDGAIRWLPAAAVGVTLGLAVPSAIAFRGATWRRDAVGWVGGHLGLERVLVMGTHLPRVAGYYLPALRTERADDGGDVARVASQLGEGVMVVCSSELAG